LESISFPFHGGKLFQQLFLALIQFGRDLDQDLDMLVTSSETIQASNSLASQSEYLATLGAGGDGKLLRPIQRGNLNFCPQGGLGERNWNLAENIVAMAFKERVGFYM
jgi:hypothetical protein